jgi:hypothetical protein
VAFYDTWDGGFSAPQHLSLIAGADGLRIALPDSDRDAACRIRRTAP